MRCVVKWCPHLASVLPRSPSRAPDADLRPLHRHRPPFCPQHSPPTVDLGATDLSLVIARDQLRPPHLQHSEPGADLLSRRLRSPRTSSSCRAAASIVGGRTSISPAGEPISPPRSRSCGSTRVATESPPPAIPTSPSSSRSPRPSCRSPRPSRRPGSGSRPADLALRPPRRQLPTPMSQSQDTTPALAELPLALGVDRLLAQIQLPQSFA